MDAILHKIKLKIEGIILLVLSLLPCRNTIIFESEGDFSDNAYAFYDYLRREGYFDSKYRAVWMVDDLEAINDGIHCISKTTRYPNIKRLYVIATCKLFIFDHNNILSNYPRRKERKVINLFHGCTFKGPKGGPEIPNTEDMMLVTSDFWKPIMARFVSCSENKIQSLGYSRNDYFFMEHNDNQRIWQTEHSWGNYNKIILWMPTFRTSIINTLSEDYYSGTTGLPIIESVSDLKELNAVLKDKSSLLVFKIHHLQMNYPAFEGFYSNIQIFKDEDIHYYGLQLYQIVALTDFLITDYSSISNDYLLLDRPMIFTLDDYEDYRDSRGFAIDDPAKYFPGYHVFDKGQLFNAITKTIDGDDPYEKDRHRLLPLMHKYRDGNSSKRISEFIGL